jgi:hypothetical protein
VTQGPKRGGLSRFTWRLIAAVWLGLAVVAWNVVFDGRVEAGARDYVDRQQLFIEGRGPHADMDQIMKAAVRSGVRRATGSSLLILAPGLGLFAWRLRRARKERQPVAE